MVSKIIKRLAKKYLNLTIYRILPHGIDEFADIKLAFPESCIKIIFDVGSNVGQSVKKFRKSTPKAIIHCFEPVLNTFKELTLNANEGQIILNNLALGSKTGELQISVPEDNTFSGVNSILHGNVLVDRSLQRLENISVTTIIAYCQQHQISQIDYLKIDTEGFDLEVLKGASKMLESQSISFIEAELSMNPENIYHVAFDEVKKYLEDFNYRLFGLYEQQSEWRPDFPMLRRVNAFFVSKCLG